ncbi:MAG: hypothetical protein A4E37_01086 [Methanoregulaceae archaeon PtaB.Bin056]|nr:MAG: hypothetical protein A4E37_01086 [Methanoregulaceae archaeon PtaB.Bin056]
MRRLPALVVSGILVLACLLLIGLQAGSPLLYSPRSDPGGADHSNPAALERAREDRAAQVLPLISDLLDSPGSLVLNIKSGDFEYAARDLQEYRQISRSLDTLVINLDMTEGELNEFRNANQQNLAILTELFNGTGRWNELQTLEIRYRDSGDSQMLTTITYEGEALRRRIQDLYRDYLEQDQVMRDTGEKFGLDTTGYGQSVIDFREIVSQIDRDQHEKMTTLQTTGTPGTGPYRLTLGIDRQRVSYMDTVRIEGLLWEHKKDHPDEVDLFIDSRKIGSIPTKPDGSFSYSHLVEHDREGTHTVFAVYSGSVFSEIRTFFVETSGTSLDLKTPSLHNGRVAFEGVLLAGSTPVRFAPIEILAEGKRSGTARTGEDGKFSSDVKLSPGSHKVHAFFSADTSPLAPSESATYEVFVPEPSPGIAGEDGLLANPYYAVILAASLCASGFGAFLYLRRQRVGLSPPIPVFHLPGERAPDGADNENLPDLDDGGTVTGVVPYTGEAEAVDTVPSGDLSSLFSALRMAVARRLAFLYPLSLTPRELCAMCRELPFRAEVCRFTSGYEQVMYSGASVPDDERDMIGSAARSAMEGMGGPDH